MTRLTTIDLHAEGIAEAQRVSTSRAWLQRGDDNAIGRRGAGRPLVARTRRHGARKCLGNRLLLILRVGVQDGAGRTIDTTLLAALVGPLSRGNRPCDRVLRAVRDAEAVARPAVDKACGRWLDAVRTTAEAFAAARVAREQAIRDRTGAGAPGSVQPGLFDRRAEHAYEVAAAAERDRDEQTRARLDAAKSHSTATHTLELVLVLTPW